MHGAGQAVESVTLRVTCDGIRQRRLHASILAVSVVIVTLITSYRAIYLACIYILSVFTHRLYVFTCRSFTFTCMCKP